MRIDTGEAATRSAEMSDPAAASARIEQLLEELRATAGPPAWQRVDELVTTLVELYGRALGRMLEEVEPARRAALADDELVGSLLALHELHPLPVDDRIRRALEAVAQTCGPVELVAVEGDAARLRAIDPPALRGAAALLERAVLEAAPELARVEIDGLREPAAAGGLVQIDVARSRAGGG